MSGRHTTAAALPPILVFDLDGTLIDSAPDITRARTLLGYEPPVAFHEGLRRSIHYYRSMATGTP